MYAQFRAAERAGLRFPGLNSDNWDDLHWWLQDHLIAYDQIRSIEEAQNA